MSPTPDFRFTPEAYQPKITHRPKRLPSPGGRETFEENYRREQDLLRRCLAKYRIYENADFHHARPLEKGKTFWDNWKIVDRGRGRFQEAREYLPLNPILNTLDTEPTSPPPPRRSRGGQRHQTEGNPVLSPWTEEGRCRTDPIISRTSSAVPYSATTPTRNGRGRFGDFDPIRCRWIAEPESEKRRDAVGYLHIKGRRQVETAEREEVGDLPILLGKGKKRAPIPADQGVYDPIKNAWLVLPENKRICEGQSFAPVSKQTFR